MDLEQAVRELEEAYRYDEDGARYPLIRALLIHGKNNEKADQEATAELVYQRVLQISPQENVAQQRLKLIWVNQGDRALEANDFEGAFDIYSKVGLSDKITEVQILKQKYELEQSALEIQQYELNEEWYEAIRCYQHLIKLDPETKRWQAQLERVEFEQSLQLQYIRGKEALNKQDWRHAIQILAGVVHTRIDYKDASELLLFSLSQRPKPSEVSVSLEPQNIPEKIVETIKKEQKYREQSELASTSRATQQPNKHGFLWPEAEDQSETHVQRKWYDIPRT